MKRPSFQFYPSDWLRDTALRSCSIGARGLWIDMICFMHEGNPYGTLKVGSKVILPVNLAAMVGATLPEVEGWLVELESAQVFDRGNDGEIMSRRMIRDENLRNIRAEGGKKGGNPALMVNGKVNHKVGSEDKQKPTSSSSSSSPSSSSFLEQKDISSPNGDSPRRAGASAAFEEFWAGVPHKLGKAAAEKAFPDALKKAGSVQVILDGLIRHEAQRQKKASPPSPILPATFLRGERWQDDYSTEISPNLAHRAEKAAKEYPQYLEPKILRF